MKLIGLGGGIKMRLKCFNCQTEKIYDSDPTRSIKDQIMAACHTSGIRFAKYWRLGVALGHMNEFMIE